MTETVQGRVPQEEIEETLKEVIDPELGVNIVDLGLLYGLRWDEDGTLILDLTLTTAACPLQEVIEEQVQANLDNLVDSWRVNWVWMPPWGPERITEDGRDMMRALGFNIDAPDSQIRYPPGAEGICLRHRAGILCGIRYVRSRCLFWAKPIFAALTMGGKYISL